ncbi:uncharacterized protein TNCV_2446791 [Trichonephila clavipes]|nr:uncharacterized protein TNCV_2446791 [Trichonephila clavipes]
MLSTEQSSRRPPHRKKCTRTANYYIGRHPGTSLGAPVSCRTIQRRLSERHWSSRHPLHVLPLTLTNQRLLLEWWHEETGLQRNGIRSSLATNPDSISAVMTIVFMCGERLNPAFALQ